MPIFDLVINISPLVLIDFADKMDMDKSFSKFKNWPDQGPVVQSVVSLTSSLRVFR